jgi:hypothetical protein
MSGSERVAIPRPQSVLDLDPQMIQVLYRIYFNETKGYLVKVPVCTFESYNTLRTYMHALLKMNKGNKVFHFNDMRETVTSEEKKWLQDDMNHRIYYRAPMMHYQLGE